ncbi:MAG TPA: CMP-N-acetlyneuraminic acid synthetase [Peptococcaceae bacterium]|nr:CMP-N-acetlyneuraminic acid synthetase [Peptococcaceae bacterium]
MYADRTVLGVIPARTGSKGLPGKNIRLLAGKPLLAYTVEAARRSGVFDCLLVSTDGEEIARVAREAGAEVPFLRPQELATDTAKGMDVLHHAMQWLEKRGRRFDLVMYLQPTSPLRGCEDIVGACRLLVERKADAVVSVCEAEHHPWWSNTLPPDLCMKDFLKPEIMGKQRQELPVFYRLNGAIYLAWWDFIRHRDSWFGPRTYAYVMARERSVDIDTVMDFLLAETIIRASLNHG